MTNEFEKWPSRFQPWPDDEENVIILDDVLIKIRQKLDRDDRKRKARLEGHLDKGGRKC